MNVRFEYLYRDAGNFKNWGEVVFANSRNISAEAVAAMADEILRADPAYFVASAIDVPDLHFSKYDEALDHGWHEVHAFNLTDDNQSDPQGRSLETFIEILNLHLVALNVSSYGFTPAIRPPEIPISGYGMLRSSKRSVPAGFHAALIRPSIKK
jgi:hypothetical protein